MVDFSVSQARKQQVVDQLFKGLAGLLKGRGVTVFSGSGTLLPGHRVRIAGNDGSTTEITGTDVVLAAGSVPRTIPGFDIDGELVMTSDEVLALEQLPGVGGGDRRRCHRVRVRLDAERPGHHGHRLRGPAHASSTAATRTWSRRWPARSASGVST